MFAGRYTYLEWLCPSLMHDIAGIGSAPRIEANLKRHGFDIKELCETLDVKPAEIRSFFKGRMPAGRTQEIEGEILKLGLVGT